LALNLLNCVTVKIAVSPSKVIPKILT